jgi:hypothetical protein
MTDLEITKLCAEAMGIKIADVWNGKYVQIAEDDPAAMQYLSPAWCPLEDDAQAMALVKRFGLRIDKHELDGWSVRKDHGFNRPPDQGFNGELNCAICQCVAEMQSQKGK